MTYYELIKDAEHKLNFNKITLGEYEEMIKPLKREIEQQPCEDAISRAEAIKIIKEHPSIVGNRSTIVQKIVELPSVTPKARWIPCSEKMPDINIHVLAQFVMGGMAECYYAHNWWHIVGGFRISGDEVIAWRPLPQPYEESENKK